MSGQIVKCFLHASHLHATLWNYLLLQSSRQTRVSQSAALYRMLTYTDGRSVSRGFFLSTPQECPYGFQSSSRHDNTAVGISYCLDATPALSNILQSAQTLFIPCTNFSVWTIPTYNWPMMIVPMFCKFIITIGSLYVTIFQKGQTLMRLREDIAPFLKLYSKSETPSKKLPAQVTSRHHVHVPAHYCRQHYGARRCTSVIQILHEEGPQSSADSHKTHIPPWLI